jgi:hypothetical protein
MKPLPLMLLFLSLPAIAQEPYRVYGEAVETPRKPPAVEACEYDELVEKQRCNARLNKSDCIREIHAECLRLFGDEREPLSDDREPRERTENGQQPPR